MDEQEDKVPIFPFQRGDVLIRLNRLADLEKLTLVHKSTCRNITEIEEDMKSWTAPRNPRQDAIQCHDKKTLQVLKRQKDRQEEKIHLLETQIRQDIEASKAEQVMIHTTNTHGKVNYDRLRKKIPDWSLGRRLYRKLRSAIFRTRHPESP